MADESTIRYGVLTGPHGLKGGVRCRKDVAEDVTLILPADVSVGYSSSFVESGRIVRSDAGRDRTEVLFFDGCENESAAREFVDKAVFVDRSVLEVKDPVVDPGLIGATVVDSDGSELGAIVDFIATPGHYVWTIELGKGDNRREWMMPAVDEFVVEIDLERRVVTVSLIPGLFDDEDAEEVPTGE